MKVAYSIKAVAAETGHSVHTIRAWERRYAALTPGRSDTNRRVYDAADVARLKLLHSAVSAGHSIGMVARLPSEELVLLGGSEERALINSTAKEDLLAICVRALQQLDSEQFEASLSRSSAVLGIDGLLSDIVGPLVREIDEGWQSGRLTIAQEHLASATIRTHLEKLRLSMRPPKDAPRLLITTPVGQIHELGALLVGIFAARIGWNTTYLGPNLPAKDIAGAARQMGAQAIALSIVFPENDPRVKEELVLLRQELDTSFPILVGGRAVDSYKATLDTINAILLKDLDQLAAYLGGKQPTALIAARTR
jgi:DNA-binding transcriptional MerR regulator/methylmalonyl-CoA mutase cobalamin-binding subunit